MLCTAVKTPVQSPWEWILIQAWVTLHNFFANSFFSRSSSSMALLFAKRSPSHPTDALCSLSQFQGTPVLVHEALSCGKPPDNGIKFYSWGEGVWWGSSVPPRSTPSPPSPPGWLCGSTWWPWRTKTRHIITWHPLFTPLLPPTPTLAP